jgi:hypothetical protein
MIKVTNSSGELIKTEFFVAERDGFTQLMNEIKLKISLSEESLMKITTIAKYTDGRGYKVYYVDPIAEFNSFKDEAAMYSSFIDNEGNVINKWYIDISTKKVADDRVYVAKAIDDLGAETNYFAPIPIDLSKLSLNCIDILGTRDVFCSERFANGVVVPQYYTRRK